MAGKAWNPSIDERLRHLEELVRRLGTRLPVAAASTVESYIIQPADLYNTPTQGWAPDGVPYPTLVREGNTVQFVGILRWDGTGGLSYPFGWSNVIRPNVIPERFRPTGTRRLLAFGDGGSGSEKYLWSAYLYATGQMQLASSHGDGTSVDPWGNLVADPIAAGLYQNATFATSYPVSPTCEESS